MVAVIFRIAAVALAGVALSGCVAGSISDYAAEPAELLPLTRTGYKTERLPPPRHPIRIGIYEIEDKTGQHKPNDLFAEYSRAVTQASTAILTDVLKKTGDGHWFRVLERQGIKDVLQERNIHDVGQQLYYKNRTIGGHDVADLKADTVEADAAIVDANQRLIQIQTELAEAKRSIADMQAASKGGSQGSMSDAQRAVFVAQQDAEIATMELKAAQLEKQLAEARAKADTAAYQQAVTIAQAKEELAKQMAHKLPPLPHSNIIIKGAITGYDSNETTGGLGARHLGIGGDVQYRRDYVTVALRAIDVRSGEVLISVTSTKTIYSKAINGQAFKFVSIDKLLEIEAGITRNEIPSLAVRHAFELAVFSLIAEGTRDGVWAFADRTIGDEVISHYESRYEWPRDNARVASWRREEPVVQEDAGGGESLK